MYIHFKITLYCRRGCLLYCVCFVCLSGRVWCGNVTHLVTTPHLTTSDQQCDQVHRRCPRQWSLVTATQAPLAPWSPPPWAGFLRASDVSSVGCSAAPGVTLTYTATVTGTLDTRPLVTLAPTPLRSPCASTQQFGNSLNSDSRDTSDNS